MRNRIYHANHKLTAFTNRDIIIFLRGDIWLQYDFEDFSQPNLEICDIGGPDNTMYVRNVASKPRHLQRSIEYREIWSYKHVNIHNISGIEHHAKDVF